MSEGYSFLKTSLVFSAPLILALIFPIFVLYRSGELTDTAYIVSIATQRVILLGRAYMPSENERYKTLSFLKKKPLVTILGTSRALQIRSEFFTTPNRFFNFANIAIPGVGVSGYRKILEQIPTTHTPKVIIIPLDPAELSVHAPPDAIEEQDANFFLTTHREEPDYLRAITVIYKDYLKRKFTLSQLLHRTDIVEPFGISACINSSAYRADGSYNYGRILSDPSNPFLEDYAFRKSFNAIVHNLSSFKEVSTVPESSFSEIQKIITLADKRGIHLVIYFPPFAPTMYTAMHDMSEKYGYMTYASARLSEIFKNSPHYFADFTDPATLNFHDDEFIDGNHTSERADAQILLKIAREDLLLKKYLAYDRLEKKLKESTDSRSLFPVFLINAAEKRLSKNTF